MYAHPTIFDVVTKNMQKKSQTEKKCERANTENRLPLSTYFCKEEKNFFFQKSYFIAIYYWRVLNIFTLWLKIVNKIKEKKKSSPKKLLRSYLVLKGSQYFYTFAQNSK
jgi:hypothetical protein